MVHSDFLLVCASGMRESKAFALLCDMHDIGIVLKHSVCLWDTWVCGFAPLIVTHATCISPGMQSETHDTSSGHLALHGFVCLHATTHIALLAQAEHFHKEPCVHF